MKNVGYCYTQSETGYILCHVVTKDFHDRWKSYITAEDDPGDEVEWDNSQVIASFLYIHHLPTQQLVDLYYRDFVEREPHTVDQLVRSGDWVDAALDEEYMEFFDDHPEHWGLGKPNLTFKEWLTLRGKKKRKVSVRAHTRMINA